jgi:hypothetical protein
VAQTLAEVMGSWQRFDRIFVSAAAFQLPITRAPEERDQLVGRAQVLASTHARAAAVVAGVVLETTLRKLCGDNNIAVGKLDKMNADLAKATVYDKLVQKDITWLAGIRNNAAHGDPVSEPTLAT